MKTKEICIAEQKKCKRGQNEDIDQLKGAVYLSYSGEGEEVPRIVHKQPVLKHNSNFF
jgi:hypothetical protein